MPRRRTPRAPLPRLTRRGGVITGAGGLLLPTALWFDLRDLLLVAFVALAVPLAAMAYVAIRPPALAVSRTFTPAVVAAGAATRVSVVVQNLSRRTFDGARWSDRVPPTLTAPAEAPMPALGPWDRSATPGGQDTARIEYRLRTPRRGVFPVGPLVVWITDPFGLARVEREAGSTDEVVVTPRVTPLEAVHATIASVDGSLHGLQRRTHPNADEPLAREYRVGDPLRRVHWAATARRGELMVREEEQRGDPEARVLLDVRLGGRPRQLLRRDPAEAPNAAFELGVELAASLGVHLLERGFRVRCDLLHDPERGVSERAGQSYRSPSGDRDLLEDLARLPGPERYAASDPDAPIVGDGRPRGREARMPGFAVLVDPDGADAAALVALRPKFEPAVVFASDTVSSAFLHVVEEADWRVVRVNRPAEIPWAWSEAARSTVATRGVPSAP